MFENHEFLYVISLFVDESIFLHDYSAQIVTNVHLLWGDVASVFRSGVIQRQVVFTRSTEIGILEQLLGLP